MNHKELDVWKKSTLLAKRIYKLTREFPKEEIYGITSQLRRASVSVSTNIAEGSARKGNKEFIQFLHISLGSLAELETLIIISRKIDYLSEKQKIETLDLITDCSKLTYGLIKYITKNKKPTIS